MSPFSCRAEGPSLPPAIVGVESNGSSDASASLSQVFAPLGPTDRCTPTQAQSMGQQVLAIIALQERNKLPLPGVREDFNS